MRVRFKMGLVDADAAFGEGNVKEGIISSFT